MRRHVKTLIVVSLIVVVAGVSGARWVIAALGPASIEAVVQAMGFRPQHPPNTLYGPGGLYLVNTFGKLTPMCDTTNLKGVVWNEGPTETRLIRTVSLVESESRLGGKTAEATGKGTSTAAISLVLRDALIRTGSLETLSEINEQLQQRPPCKKELDKALKAGRCVAQSLSVFIATLDYEYHEGGTIEGAGGGDLTPHKGPVKTSVSPEKLKLAINTRIARSDLRVGENLYYGLQLTDRCMARPDDERARYVPDETWWLFKTAANRIPGWLGG
jgi:hypothetical protein